MALTVEERAALRPAIDAARVERFLECVAPATNVRAHLLAALSAHRGVGFRSGAQLGGAMLPAQPEDLAFGDPVLDREWRALARGAV